MNWIVLKSLNQLYQDRKTRIKASLKKDATFNFLLNTTKEIVEVGKNYHPADGFDAYYESNHLYNYEKYLNFLQDLDFLKPQTRFEDSDIEILINLDKRMRSGELLPIRNQIIEAEETVRGVSSMFFRNEKHLLKKESLIDAVKVILQIKELADDKEQQYMYRLECDSPKLIILCENLNFLNRPSRARPNNYELWYAGGKNISKLDYVDTRGLPIFYSADWDYDGLLIFQMVIEKIPDIKLLLPSAASKSIRETDHESFWKERSCPELLSMLNQDLYSEEYQKKIKELISLDHWIIEEDNDLKKMIALYENG